MSLDTTMIEVVSRNLPASAGYGSHSLQAMNLIFIESRRTCHFEGASQHFQSFLDARR
jgi:hypothetical protein